MEVLQAFRFCNTLKFLDESCANTSTKTIGCNVAGTKLAALKNSRANTNNFVTDFGENSQFAFWVVGVSGKAFRPDWN